MQWLASPDSRSHILDMVPGWREGGGEDVLMAF